MKSMCGVRKLFVFVITVAPIIFVGCGYTPKPATVSKASNNTDREMVFNNVKAAIRSMGLIVKEQDMESGYISGVKGDLSPFTLQVYLKPQDNDIVVEAKCVANCEYIKGFPYSSPGDELPENVVAEFFQTMKEIR